MRERAKAFAKDIVLLCREIKSEHKESIMTNQLLRSGTSIGANIHEAETMHEKIKRYQEKADRQNASQPYRNRDKGAR